MKKVITSILLALGCSMAAFAVSGVWTSSHTATADTTKILCQSQTYVVNGSTINTGGRGILHSVCVNDGASGTVTVYNSSSTAVNAVAVIRSTAALTAGCNIYDINMSSGIVYTNSTTTDVTFTYECY